jgi:hypothetical protein
MMKRSISLPDNLEAVARKILKAFDQGKAVAYPGRMSVEIATLFSPDYFLVT